MKKRVILIPLVLLLAGGGAGGWYYYNQNQPTASEDAVSVDKMSNVLGIPSMSGSLNRFAGVVEPQKTEGIELVGGMKVKKNFVTVGSEVQIGDKLFEYDTENAQDQITQLEIDIENCDISIESDTNQVKELEKYRDKAKEEDKLSITTQIMTTQNSIKRYEYEKKGKIAEMESLKKQIANSIVYSEFQGLVKTINASLAGGNDDNYDVYGGNNDESSNAYMTIMSTGEYRIKGKLNEQNMMDMRIGIPVLVYSRVDESLVWHGFVQNIDKEHGSSSNSNDFYGGGDDSLTGTTTYPFYIEMESSDGLMLGQHVFIEQDLGQNEQNGMWLEDYYFIPDENGEMTPYVWAANSKDQLEKRKVTVGDYNEELMTYEILGGLTLDDYITFPDESYTEGMPVIYNEDIDYGDFNSEFMDGDWEELDFSDMDFSDEDDSDDEFYGDGLSSGEVEFLGGDDEDWDEGDEEFGVWEEDDEFEWDEADDSDWDDLDDIEVEEDKKGSASAGFARKIKNGVD